MKVLTTSTDSQTIKIIPREYVTTATLKITDDTTNVESEYNVSPTTNRNYLEIENDYSLKEGGFYNLVLENDNGEVIYRDKIFCTDQNVDQSTNDYYTINKDVYTIDTSYDNDFIVL